MEENYKIAILISTYNGEKYIKEQINSLIDQTYEPIDIYIRDDGSTDNTKIILKEYEREYSNIYVFYENNIGYAKSFYKILEKAKNYDFYAFCDQDDKWHKDKIEKALNMILNDNYEEKIPTCLCTEYNYCDEKLNYKGISKLNNGGMNFRNSLVEAAISGNTTLFNKYMANEILKFGVDSIFCHDWLLYSIATGIGKLLYDENPSLEYRRTVNNASPRGTGRIKLLVYRIKKFLFGDYLKGLQMQTKKFKELYYEKLSKENKRNINLFTNEKYSLIISLKKVFFPKKFRQKLADEVLIRFMFLIGKI